MSQGVYHVFNVAKLRIMEVVYREYPKPVSSKQIAKETGMEQNKVSRLLSHYHSHQYGYFRRLKKRDADGSYRYKINRKGVKSYFEFIVRVKSGFDLNLKKQTPIKLVDYKRLQKPKIKSEMDLALSPEMLAPYVKLSYRGQYELNVKREDALRIVGIVKDEPVEPVETLANKHEEPIRPNPLKKTVDEIDYVQASIVIREEVKRIQEKLKTVDDIDEIKELRNRLNKCLRWYENNKEIL
jgi:transcription initiation factor IIE alpha subunit